MENLYFNITNAQPLTKVKNEFYEEWIKLCMSDYASKYAYDAAYNNKSCITCEGVVSVEPAIGSMSDKHYIAAYCGGLNGHGEWNKYLIEIDYILKNLGKSWIIDIHYDTIDDTFTMIVGFVTSYNEQSSKFNIGDKVICKNITDYWDHNGLSGIVREVILNKDNTYLYRVAISGVNINIREDDLEHDNSVFPKTKFNNGDYVKVNSTNEYGTVQNIRFANGNTYYEVNRVYYKENEIEAVDTFKEHIETNPICDKVVKDESEELIPKYKNGELVKILTIGETGIITSVVTGNKKIFYEIDNDVLYAEEDISNKFEIADDEVSYTMSENEYESLTLNKSIEELVNKTIETKLNEITENTKEYLDSLFVPLKKDVEEIKKITEIIKNSPSYN